MQIRQGSAASYSDVGITALLLSGRARMLDNHNKKQKERKSIMKKRLVALLLILALVICVFSVRAFAYEGASPRGGWTITRRMIRRAGTASSGQIPPVP